MSDSKLDEKIDNNYINNEREFDSAVFEERSRLGSQKKKLKDTARLIWASKPRKEPSAKDLMFQTAEEVYPNVAKGYLTSFFDKNQTDISKNPNRLIWGDNLLVMQALLAQGYEGQIDLIYIDPPFNTGESFNFSNEVQIGNEKFEKELPIVERLAYTDCWKRGIDSFLDMLYPRLQLMKRLLSNNGSIYLHCDQNASHYIKIIMDEIFYKENFRNEIIWRRAYSHNDGKKFGVITDSLLYYTKSSDYTFNSISVERSDEQTIKEYPHIEKETQKRYKSVSMNASGSGSAKYFGEKLLTPPPGTHWRWTQDRINKAVKDGLIFFTKNGVPRYKQYAEDIEGKQIQNLWSDFMGLSSQANERVGYPTQKPEELLERIITASSKKDSLIADFFVGSGTTSKAAEALGRRWIASDLSKTAIQVTRSGLVDENAQPFIIENLGNYQRQLIYLQEIKLKEMYDIILNLYGARPREDRQGVGISNTDKNTIVYVCEPDRPMTARKAVELAKDAQKLDGKGYRTLVILAWDYDYNYDEDLKKIKSSFKSIANIESRIIPSDVYRYLRSTKVGDASLSEKIVFYQKPYVHISDPTIVSKEGDNQIVKVSIEQYVVMDNPIRDEEKRKEVEALLKKNYAYLIDFWAVDSDYDAQTFRSRWQAIRNKKSKEPVITSADFKLKKGKKYKIAVRVVDVFGNDASAVKEIDLR